jgi:predicted dehydrogenase
VADGLLGRVYHARASYLQSWGGPDTPLLWRFQGDIAGSGAHGDLNAHIVDLVRFVTGEEVVTIEGRIEHTFIEERRCSRARPAARSPGPAPPRPGARAAARWTTRCCSWAG